MDKLIVEKFMISKEDLKKYFDNKRIITKKEYESYIFSKKLSR